MLNSPDETGFGLYKLEKKTITNCVIDDRQICGWGGDGTSCVQGEKEGSISYHLRDNPFMLKIWCVSHLENLAFDDLHKLSEFEVF